MMYLNQVTEFQGKPNLDCLTVTYDVFKYNYRANIMAKNSGLTVTYDVFK